MPITRRKLDRIRRAHNRWRRKVKPYYRGLPQPPRWDVFLEGVIRAAPLDGPYARWSGHIEATISRWYYTVQDIYYTVCEAQRLGLPIHVDAPGVLDPKTAKTFVREPSA